MRHTRFLPAFLACSLTAAIMGCSTIVVVDGKSMSEPTWEADAKSLRAEAGFLFKCPADQISLTVLDTFADFNGDIARVVGVSGCGDTGVYKRIDGRWYMEAARGDAPAAAAPSEPTPPAGGTPL